MGHRETVASSSDVKSIFPDRKALPNSSLEILNWMIHIKFTRKEFEQCKKLAEEELKRSNNYSEYANFILGNICKEEGEIQKALEYFKRCSSLKPQNVEYLKQIGRCLFLLGRYKLALEIFVKADELSEIADWNIYHHLGPTILRVLRSYGRDKSQLNNDLGLFVRARCNLPHEENDQPLKVMAHLDFPQFTELMLPINKNPSICYLKSQQEDKALEYLKQAVLTGRSEKSFSELAKLYENLKDHPNAINTYKAALRLYPSSTELSVTLALIYMKVEDYKNAFNQLGNALAHDPVNADALFTFAAEIQRQAEYDVATVKYKLAAQSLPECAEMWNNIGMCFFGKRRYIAAITCLKRSFYLNPMNWLTTYNLGLLHLNTKQFASAALFLSTTAKLNSQYGPTFTLLALALKHLGDSVNCRRSFEEALKRNENDVEACINYAVFLYTMNENSEALKYYAHYQQLLNITPNVDKELIHMGTSLAEALQISNQTIVKNSACADTRKNDSIVPDADNGNKLSSNKEKYKKPSSAATVSESSAPSFQTTTGSNLMENEINVDADLV